MMQEEDIAKDNLRAFSQNTHYLLDWNKQPETQNLQNHKKNYYSHKKIECHQSPRKLEHKKYEKKQDLLHRFQYPIVQEEAHKPAKSKKYVKGHPQLTLSQIKKQRDKRSKQSKVINKLVQDEFNKVTQQVFTTLHPVPKLPSQPHKKSKSNSLPFIFKKKMSLESQRKIGMPAAAIIIDNYEPPQSSGSHRRSSSMSYRPFAI